MALSLAVKRVTKQNTGHQGGGQQCKTRRDKTKSQALERQQGQTIVGILCQADVVLGTRHHPGMHHGGGKHAVSR